MKSFTLPSLALCCQCQPLVANALDTVEVRVLRAFRQSRNTRAISMVPCEHSTSLVVPLCERLWRILAKLLLDVLKSSAIPEKSSRALIKENFLRRTSTCSVIRSYGRFRIRLANHNQRLSSDFQLESFKQTLEVRASLCAFRFN